MSQENATPPGIAPDLPEPCLRVSPALLLHILSASTKESLNDRSPWQQKNRKEKPEEAEQKKPR